MKRPAHAPTFRVRQSVHATDDTLTAVLAMKPRNPLNGGTGHSMIAGMLASKERKRLRQTTALVCSAARSIPGPWVITLTRIAPKAYDFDGWVAAAKGVRDGVTDALGLRDDSDPRLTWVYEQERGAVKTYGVRVTVRGASAEARPGQDGVSVQGGAADNDGARGAS